MSDEKTVLTKQLTKVHQRLSAIERKEWAKENADLVGTYWKCKNCYSRLEKPSDYWWAYRKLTSLSVRGQHFLAFTFQTDKYGHIRIEREEFCSGRSSWEPCTKKEFNRAWGKLVKSIQQVRP